MPSSTISRARSQVDFCWDDAFGGPNVNTFSDGFGVRGLRDVSAETGANPLTAGLSLAEDPDGGRSVMLVDNGSADSTQWPVCHMALQAGPQGAVQGDNAEITDGSRIAILAHVWFDTSLYGAGTSGNRVIWAKLITSGNTYAASPFVQFMFKCSGSTAFDQLQIQGAGYATADSAVQDLSAYLNAWTTVLIETENGTGDALVRVTFAQGKLNSAAEVRAAVGSTATVVYEDDSGTISDNFKGFQIHSRALQAKRWRTYWRAIAFGDHEANDPQIIDQQLVGQLIEANGTAVGLFVHCPPGLIDHDWVADGIDARIKYWPTSAAEGTALYTSWAELPATSLYSKCFKVTGVTPNTTAYTMRVELRNSTSETGDTEAGHTISYTPPSAGMKIGVSFCSRNDGAAQPFEAAQSWLDNGCIAAVSSDDVGYSDIWNAGVNYGVADASKIDFIRTQLEYAGDQALSLCRRQMLHIVRPGDHQWENDVGFAYRAAEAATYANGANAWYEVWGAGQMGLLSEGNTPPEQFRYFEWGGYGFVVIADACQYSDGSYQIRQAGVDGATAAANNDEQYEKFVAAVQGRSVNDLIVLSSRIHGLKLNGTKSIQLVQTDNWAGSASAWAQWESLVDEFRSAGVNSMVLWTGDMHYTEMCLVNDPLIHYELTSGPMSSSEHLTAVGGDFTNNTDGDLQLLGTTRLYGYNAGPGDGSVHILRVWSIVTMTPSTHTVSFYEANADMTTATLLKQVSVLVGGGTRNIGRPTRVNRPR